MATYKGLGFDQTTARTRTGTASDTIDFDTNVIIDGNLDVSGTIISRDEERVLIQDNFLDINFGYVTNTGLAGGIAVNFLPTTTGVTINTTTAAKSITFTAQDGAANPNLNCETDGDLPADTFASGDIIQIAGTTNAQNDGFYIVNTNAVAGTVEIMDVNDTINMNASQVNFTAETENTSTSVTVFKITVSLLQANSSTGVFEVQEGSTNAEFATFKSLGGSLQVAYDLGATILTDATGAIAFTLAADAQGFSVEGGSSGNGIVSIGGTTAVDSFIVNASGAASSITATGQTLSLGTTGVNELDITSTGGVDINGSGAASAFSSTAQSLTLETLTSGALTITSAGTLTATGAGVSKYGDDVATLDFSGTGAVTETAMTSFAITPSAAITLTGGTTAALASTSGSAMSISDGVFTLSATSGAVSESGLTTCDLSGSGTMNITGGGVSTFGDDTAVWSFDGAGALSETGMTSATITPSAAITLTAGAASTWSTSAGALTLTSAAAATWSTAAGILALDGAGGVSIVGNAGEIDLTTSAAVDINSGAGTWDATTLTQVSTDNLTLEMAADIDTVKTLKIKASNLDAAGSANMTLDADEISISASLVGQFSAFASKSHAAFAKGDILYMLATTGRVDASDADGIATSRIVGVAGKAASGASETIPVINYGVVSVVADAVVATSLMGSPCYVSLTAGKVTMTPPTAAGDVVYQVGIVTLADGGTGVDVLLQPQFILENG